jgi:hypothetical protein
MLGGMGDVDAGLAPDRDDAARPPRAPRRARAATRVIWIAGIVLWAISMVAAFGALWRYKTTPAVVGESAPARWPDDSSLARISRTPGRATIVMLAHPKCPCTRASIGELAALMTQLGDRATATVLFVAPNGVEQDWERSDTWSRASELRGVEVVRDTGGALAKQLGATVSGHTVVYDDGGALIFQGGITSARGHAGDNVGRSSIVALLSRTPRTSGTELARAPTFGCDLSGNSQGRGSP